MADDDVTNSLLNEYSIAEVSTGSGEGNETQVQEVHRESLRDAFSRYAKVIFHDIADSYPTDADVQCFFSLTIDMKHKDGDVVGLFRLGWRSPSEMITSQIVPNPVTEDQRDFQVQFRASDLPKDEGEIYQLCYISANEVWGASVPFEFRRATAEELLVVDSGDIVIVRSQSAVAEDLKSQLATMRKELTAAENSNVEAGKKLAELNEENKLLKGRLKDLEKVEQVLERFRADNQALDKSRNDSEESLRKAELHIIALDSVISSLQTDMDNVQRQVASQAEELAKQQSIALNATTQRGCTHDLIEALREGKELAVREMRAALAENETMHLQLTVSNDDKALLHQQLDELSEKYRGVVQDLEESDETYKKRIEDLLVQLTQLTSESQQRVSEARTETEVLQKHVKSLETELENREQILKTLSAQVGSNSLQLQEHSPKQQKVKEDATELKVLKRNLEDVRASYLEVCDKIKVLRTDMGILQQTETSLLESRKRLASRVNSLQNIVTEAEGAGNTVEASLHQRELGVARAKLEEKCVCIESAHQRRSELEQQLNELQQESSVLTQQEAEVSAALANFRDNPKENGKLLPPSSSTANQVESEEAHIRESFQRAAEAWNGQVEVEVADLRERLRQAAEAYKILYREKMQLERQLPRVQEVERNNHEEPEP